VVSFHETDNTKEELAAATALVVMDLSRAHDLPADPFTHPFTTTTKRLNS
jgi:hypothetical protein